MKKSPTSPNIGFPGNLILPSFNKYVDLKCNNLREIRFTCKLLEFRLSRHQRF